MVDSMLLYNELASLPEKMQQEVADLIHTLKKKVEEEAPKQKPTGPVFGSMPGLIKYMSPDFDEPLEDFKDYM